MENKKRYENMLVVIHAINRLDESLRLQEVVFDSLRVQVKVIPTLQETLNDVASNLDDLMQASHDALECLMDMVNDFIDSEEVESYENLIDFINDVAVSRSMHSASKYHVNRLSFKLKNGFYHLKDLEGKKCISNDETIVRDVIKKMLFDFMVEYL